MKSLLISILLLPFFSTAEVKQECNKSSKNFYQCIESNLIEHLPSTQWCSLISINKKDNTDGLILLTIALDKLNNFSHEQIYINPEGQASLSASATGTWELKKQLVSLNYVSVDSDDNELLPGEVYADFADLESQELVLTSTEKEEKFFSFKFVKCDTIVSKD